MSEAAALELTRRQALAAGIGVAAAVAGAAAGSDAAPAPKGAGRAAGSPGRMPVAYIPHGGGPWPFVEMGMDAQEREALAAYLRGLPQLSGPAPAALLVISAHWEEAAPTVMSSPAPGILYDYYGFPPESYQITWPAPGHPALAARVRALLQAGGFDTGADEARGFDHGTFIPLKVSWPQAEIPTVQLSLKRGLDPAEHLAMGRALGPLRDEGVLILGSGMSYHNMRGFRDPRALPSARLFDAWLRETVVQEPEERDRRLRRWADAPGARQSHPREEHLLPLMVAAGAAGVDRGALAFAGPVFQMPIVGVHFGQAPAPARGPAEGSPA